MNRAPLSLWLPTANTTPGTASASSECWMGKRCSKISWLKKQHMLKNWFLIAMRNFSRQKSYSLLNITGLAIGMACAGLIFLWVKDELSYDTHDAKRDRIYGIMQHWKMDAA